MRYSLLWAFLFTFSVYSFAASFTANTTLGAETGNNTSASSSFTKQSNGNLGAGNVSTVSVKSLLYPGATTKTYAHLMAWFGSSKHMDVGYISNDPTQVRKQVNAMRARGIDGVIIDWYGRNRTREDQATDYFRQEGERLGGAFKFAVVEDQGALKPCASTPGCNVTSELIADLNYVYSNYMRSSAYMRISGRPVVYFFGVENFYIDWNRVRSSVMGNPLLIRQNQGGFTEWQSNGAFAWVIIDRSNPTNIGLPYLDSFYSTAISNLYKPPTGAVYKGFNDSLAAWHPNPPRVMYQNCGQTWLRTWNEIRRYYSTYRQLPSMQLVTWNDYEEGTALEVGIDNCVSVSASTSGSYVQWSIAGQQNTIDHFTVFISKDGHSLMKLKDVPASWRSLDVKPWAFPSGTYIAYVKAVGKPLITNKMSAGVTLRLGSTTSYGVHITTPTTGASYGNSVHVAGYATSSVAIRAINVYVDGVKRYVTYSSKADAWLKMNDGTRYVTMQAWDAAGKIYKSTAVIKVQ